MKIAALTHEITPQQITRIQLLPAGRFRSTDTRPEDVPAWILNDTNGYAVTSQANDAVNDLVIDYEHQTILKEENGQPAPAAGWIKNVEYIPGRGLFADVEWTDKADAMISAKEYRYTSAVFSYDAAGYVTRLHHAGITNVPALDGMNELLAACSKVFTTKEANHMNEILKLLQQAFNMPEATEAQIQAALTALLQQQPQNVALSSVFSAISERDAKIATLTAQVSNPDPAKLVPVETMQQLQNQIATLTAQINNNNAAQVINKALAEGKLLPAQKKWATNLTATADGLAQLNAYLDTVAPVAALSQQAGLQSAVNLTDKNLAALSADEKAAAKMLGYSEAEYLELMKKDEK